MTDAGVIWLNEGNFDALILEVALRLGKVEWGMVWSGVPGETSTRLIQTGVKHLGTLQGFHCVTRTHQLVKKVILSVDILSFKGYAGIISTQTLGMKGWDDSKSACPFAGIIQIKFNGTSQINLTLSLTPVEISSIRGKDWTSS